MAISRGFSAEDLNGVRLPGPFDALANIGVDSRSGIVCDLEFSFNIDKKHFGFVLRSETTEPTNSSRLFHSMRLTVLRNFEGDSFNFCFTDSFFLIKLSMEPDIQGMGFPPLSLFGPMRCQWSPRGCLAN